MIYRGYAIFRRSRGIVGMREKAPSGYHGNISRLGPYLFIWLNKDDSLDEKAKTFVHELLHIGYEYGTKDWDIIPGFPIPKDRGISEDEAKIIIRILENIVEEETEKVLQNQPVLVNHLKQLISSRVNN